MYRVEILIEGNERTGRFDRTTDCHLLEENGELPCCSSWSRVHYSTENTLCRLRFQEHTSGVEEKMAFDSFRSWLVFWGPNKASKNKNQHFNARGDGRYPADDPYSAIYVMKPLATLPLEVDAQKV